MILGCAPGVHEAFHQVRLEVMEIHEPDKQVHVTVFPAIGVSFSFRTGGDLSRI